MGLFDVLSGDGGSVDETSLASEYRQIMEDVRAQAFDHFGSAETFVIPSEKSAGRSMTPSDQLFITNEDDPRSPDHEDTGTAVVYFEPEKYSVEELKDISPNRSAPHETIDAKLHHLAEVFYEQTLLTLASHEADPENYGLDLEFRVRLPETVPAENGEEESIDVDYSLRMDTGEIISTAEDIGGEDLEAFYEKQAKRDESEPSDLVTDGIPEAIEKYDRGFTQNDFSDGSTRFRRYPQGLSQEGPMGR